MIAANNNRLHLILLTEMVNLAMILVACNFLSQGIVAQGYLFGFNWMMIMNI